MHMILIDEFEVESRMIDYARFNELFHCNTFYERNTKMSTPTTKYPIVCCVIAHKTDKKSEALILEKTIMASSETNAKIELFRSTELKDKSPDDVTIYTHRPFC